MFLFKKIASRFLFPVPLSIELLVVGLILLWFTRRQKLGKVLTTCGTLLLLVLSNGLISEHLLHHLEHRYRGLIVSGAAAPSPAVSYIAVLGGGANDDPDVPVSSHLSPDEMERAIEGVRLYREMPGTKLILSGGYTCGQSLTEVAEALGVKPEDTMRLNEPRDTADESQQIAAIVGSQKFVLVTSASHMPRAMGLFKKRGMQPIPAPTDFLTPRSPVESDDFFPDAYKLFKSQVAFYEYLGLTWESLRGQI